MKKLYWLQFVESLERQEECWPDTFFLTLRVFNKSTALEKFASIGIQTKTELVGIQTKTELVGIQTKTDLVGICTKMELKLKVAGQHHIHIN